MAQVTVIEPETPQTAPEQPTDVYIAVEAFSEDEAKAFIYQKESGNNSYAINQSSGACGLGQALPCSKMGCDLSDYQCQDNWFTNYCINRYGSWSNAKAFWLQHFYW